VPPNTGPLPELLEAALELEEVGLLDATELAGCELGALLLTELLTELLLTELCEPPTIPQGAG
jgi:hypothetical protein